MNTRSLFDKDEAFTEDAKELFNEMERFAEEQVERYCKRGYKVREIQAVMNAAVGMSAMKKLAARGTSAFSDK